jgi:hypothetical protein
MANDIFTNHMNILLEKGSKFIENYMVIGDLNYDILKNIMVSTVSPLKFVAIDLKYGIFKRLI